MIIRSALFYLLIFMWTLCLGIISLPCLFSPRKYTRKLANIWISGILSLLRFICGITYEVKGRKNIPNHPVIVASKHQSAFQTFLIFKLNKNSVFIHKKELFFIPIFGLYLKKSNMISINRNEGPKALRKMLYEAKQKIESGSSIIIFPEGTRKKPGETTDYKTGIAGIYKETETEILPVALNSGYFWPKHPFIKSTGHIIINFLETIPSKLERSQLLKKIEITIETETNKLNKHNF